MGLVGSLEDLGLGDILQIVSLSRKSGVLNLSWGEVKGKIIFRDGQVVAATATSRKKLLSELLLRQGKIDAAKSPAVDRAVESLPDASNIKETLVKDLGVNEEAYDELLRSHIEGVVFHFFTWPEGIFSFELQDITEELAAMAGQDKAFVLEVGLSPQFLAMEGTRLKDEDRRRREEGPVGPPLKSGDFGEPGPADEIPPPAPEPPPPAAEKPGESEQDFSSVSDALAFYESKGGASQNPAPNPEPAARDTGEQAGAAPEPPEPDSVISWEDEKAVTGKPAPPKAPAPEPAAADLVLVDDDEFTVESIVYHLAAKGYRIKSFDKVGPALAYIQEMVDLGERPKAVIADLIMPSSGGDSTLGGLELLEKAKVINPSISLYIMSDYENLPARDKARELGSRFFFMKPKASQLDDEYGSPELINFIGVLENALQSEVEPSKAERPAAREPGLVNLGDELRKEFGEEVIPIHPDLEYLTPSRGLHMLKVMINELNDPASSGQITLLILRFAAEMMNRAVIFLVAKNQLAGLGQFGIKIDGDEPNKHVRQIRIPLKDPSIFREAIQKRLPLKKPLKDIRWNNYLVEKLGGEKPPEVFVAPIIAGGKIAAILYGDNVPEDKEIGDTESLEIFLAQAGLAMEKALLERKIKEMGDVPEPS